MATDDEGNLLTNVGAARPAYQMAPAVVTPIPTQFHFTNVSGYPSSLLPNGSDIFIVGGGVGAPGQKVIVSSGGHLSLICLVTGQWQAICYTGTVSFG